MKQSGFTDLEYAQKKRLGKNFIFLISQPRAGSTLLQRMLSSHNKIHTIPEPWVMLHPIYALKDSGICTEYGNHIARHGLTRTFEELPNGKDDYIEALRMMLASIYNNLIDSSGKEFFLDKTPRYYYIIPEIIRVFPESHVIILIRNPVAVLVSLLNSWIKFNYLKLEYFRDDFLVAPFELLNNLRKENGFYVKYEELLLDPRLVMNQLCEDIGIDFNDDLLKYDKEALSRDDLGDERGIWLFDQPSISRLNVWEESLCDPQIWRFAYDYIHILGRDTVKGLGYSFDDLLKKLEETRPGKISLLFTFSLLSASAVSSEKSFGSTLMRYYIRVYSKCRRLLAAA